MKAGLVSVGETLSRARRQRGLSIADVSADTRIRATLIEAIEADDFAPCGGAVYARGHIRSIAKVVGVDAEPLIEEFDELYHVERPPILTSVSAQPTDPEIVARSERHRPNWNVAMGIALTVICVLAVIGLVTSHSGGNGHRTTTQLSATGGHHNSGTKKSGPSPAPSTVAQLPAQRASMLIRVLTSQTWLSMKTKSGGLLFEGLLPAGQHRLFTNKHGLSFIIGNAPAVDVVVNGHDIGSPPSSGSVSKGNVTPGADTVQAA
jgi:cytoskeletal protein RodZ